MTFGLIDALRAHAEDSSRALIETPTGRILTYRAALTGSGRIAAAMRHLGVAPGDRVVAQIDKSPEALLLYLACLRSGAVLVPLNTAYTMAELEYFISDAEPSLVVCRTEGADAVEALCARLGIPHCLSLSSHPRGSFVETVKRLGAAEFEDKPRKRDDIAALLYTSGTTGRSKGAMLSYGNLASNAAALADLWRFTRDDVLIHALPIFHTHGLFVGCNVSIVAGSGMIFLPRFDPQEVLEFASRATVLMGVPTFYSRLLELPQFNAASVAKMRLFVSGSAPLLPATHSEWRERTGHAILERYGMTETNMNASNPYEGDRIPGSVGLPLPGIEIRITDEHDGRVLDTGATGMIEVRGPNVFRGYWRMPAKTKAEFRPDGFFITGDLGRIDEHGYLWIVGRAKDLVITGGYNVYPKEVELEIDALDGVVESAVIGLPHPDLGEAVTAFVVADRNAPGLTEPEIIQHLKGKLAGYKVPKRVVIVDDLPRNAMGKVQKALLRNSGS